MSKGYSNCKRIYIFLVLVVITKHLSTAADFDCNFDSGTCGFRQVSSWGNGWNQDHKDWQRHTGATPTADTGPSQDHTTGNGYYMFFYVGSHHGCCSKASMYKTLTVTKDNSWFSFYYYMWAKGLAEYVGELRAYVNRNQVFYKSGSQGNGWKRFDIKLNVAVPSQVEIRFVAKKGSFQTKLGDIAIDDVLVDVFHEANVTNITAVNNMTCLNSYVDLECTDNSYPPANLYWYFLNGVLIRKYSVGNVRLQTRTVGIANYSCMPENVVGTGINASIAITTTGPPTIESFPPGQQEVVEGSRFILYANVSGKEPLTVVWKRWSTNYPASKNVTFERIQNSDGGSFEFTVTDGYGCRKTSPQTRVTVLYKPIRTSLYANPGRLCMKNVVTLSCYATARPSPHGYLIYLNGQLIQSSTSSRTSVQVTSSGSQTFLCAPNNTIGVGENATRVVQSIVPPNVTYITPNQTVLESSKVVLFCNVSGDEPITISWTKNGASFGTGPNVTIENAATVDNGAYACSANNGNECPTARSPSATYLYVQYKPRHTRITVSNSTVCLNDPVYLECNTTADPPADQYSFFLNDQLLETSSSPRIYINSTTEGNNSYTCQPRNAAGPGENATVFMYTKAPPNITWLTPNQSSAEGSKVTFMCNVTGSEPITIAWRKIGVSNSRLPDGQRLDIQTLRISDHGIYECIVTNGKECPVKKTSTYINVLYQPRITTLPEAALTLYENDQIKLSCEADGNPAPNITWARDNDVIGHGENLVLSAEQSTPGIYTCTATNRIGVHMTANSNVVVKTCENVCKSNTGCLRQGTTFRCDCPRGLTGKFCEKKDPIGEKFSFQITVIELAWNDEYQDSSSIRFKSLETNICSEIKKLFWKTLVKCKLVKARKGSIITETELGFNETKTQSEVQGVIAKATANQTLGPLKLEPSASPQAVVKESVCENNPCLFDGECIAQGDGYTCECKLFRYGANCEKGISLAAGIIIIVIVVLFIIVISYIIVFRICCKSGKKGYATDSVKKSDIKMSSYKVKDEAHFASSINNPAFDG